MMGPGMMLLLPNEKSLGNLLMEDIYLSTYVQSTVRALLAYEEEH